MEKKSKEDIRKELLEQQTNDDYRGLIEEIQELDPNLLLFHGEDWYGKK